MEAFCESKTVCAELSEYNFLLSQTERWTPTVHRGASAPLVYSSTRHSAKFTFDYVVCLKFIDVFDIISIWIGLIITDLP